LHEAYRRQDLERVTEILTTLQTGKSLGSVADDVNNLEKLQAKIAALREQIAILEIEVKRLQDDEIYQQILLIDDRESYFSELSKELEIELTALKKVAT
jgi:cell division protein FtsB